MSTVLPLHASPAQHIAAAETLRVLAAAALVRGDWRQAAQLYADAKTLRREGEEMAGVMGRGRG
jgi:hypothetical protein